jgi:hypothetical protein
VVSVAPGVYASGDVTGILSTAAFRGRLEWVTINIPEKDLDFIDSG